MPVVITAPPRPNPLAAPRPLVEREASSGGARHADVHARSNRASA